MLQRFDQHLHRAGNLPLGIGILNPQKEHAAALVGHALRGQALNQISQMDKPGGGGSHSGDNRSLRHIPRRVFGFQLLRGHGDMGEQKLCQCKVIHCFYLFLMI